MGAINTAPGCQRGHRAGPHPSGACLQGCVQRKSLKEIFFFAHVFDADKQVSIKLTNQGLRDNAEDGMFQKAALLLGGQRLAQRLCIYSEGRCRLFPGSGEEHLGPVILGAFGFRVQGLGAGGTPGSRGAPVLSSAESRPYLYLHWLASADEEMDTGVWEGLWGCESGPSRCCTPHSTPPLGRAPPCRANVLSSE